VHRRILTVFCLSLVALLPEHSVLALSPTTGLCDTSGPYTDRLCPGEALNDGEYLVSPNGNYRLYYQNGGLVLYSWSGSPSVIDTWYPATPNTSPDEFVYGDSTVTALTGNPSNVAFWIDVNSTDVLDYSSSFAGSVYGDHAFIVPNSLLELTGAYDDGGFLWSPFCAWC
jgi:hypothetical protein